ncbi:MAG: hypothetical protein EOP59_09050 [Sphingomonadales bacterium]|nr:MAG: hypothetical protein EOP59_09050 [Sphingomonadales bacterium]
MVTPQQNRLLTRVEGDAPMGRLMRERHWIPCALSETLVADGAPKAIKLLGSRYVAFRATDGRVGFFDEACPHRGVSLALARNEDCALRCIFHAWKFDVSGKAVEVPSEGERSAAFAAQVKLNHYPTFEGGGLLWVFLGVAAPPPRPPLPFLDLPAESVWISRSVTPCNWLQGVEGTLDSVHVGTLHQSWIMKLQQERTSSSIGHALSSHPRYEDEDTAYGLRAAAIRALPDGRQYLRITEYVLPFVSLVPGGATDRQGTMFIAIPVDDHSHMLFWGLWDEDGVTDHRAAEELQRSVPRDIDNYVVAHPGPDGIWGQNRAAMANGHFSGFDGALLDEDVAVQASMGPIVDRSKEQLCGSDVAIVRARRRLLDAVNVGLDARENAPAAIVRPLDTVQPAGYRWRKAGRADEAKLQPA